MVYLGGKLSNRPGSEKKGLVWFHALCMGPFNSVNFKTTAGKTKRCRGFKEIQPPRSCNCFHLKKCSFKR